MPIRTVLFTGLTKYDGHAAPGCSRPASSTRSPAGPGGPGYDTVGTVVVQAPEHVVENERALAKAGDDPKKRRKVVRKKPPEGFVAWGQPTFERLVAAEPEPLTSSFAVSHAMLLNVIGRPGDAFAAMRHLLTDNHEDRAAQRRHIRRAIAIYRALLAAGVVERLDEPDEDGRPVRLTVDLQLDFALNQPLSPFALAAIELLDRDVAGVRPRRAVGHRVHAGRPAAGARPPSSSRRAARRSPQMKADGIEYEERMELLEDGRPTPSRWPSCSTAAFELYRRGHPWVADHAAVAQVGGPRHVRAGDDLRRVRRLLRAGPLRGAGAALPRRRLQGAAPDRARGRQDRGADRPHRVAGRAGPPGRLQPARRVGAAAQPATRRRRRRAGSTTARRRSPRNPRAFRVLVRNALFRRVELAALRRYDELGELDGERRLGRRRAGREALEPYFDEYDEIGTGPDARGPALLHHRASSPDRWLVRQIFDDPAGDHDWGISAEVDLRRLRRGRHRGRPHCRGRPPVDPAGAGQHRPAPAVDRQPRMASRRVSRTRSATARGGPSAALAAGVSTPGCGRVGARASAASSAAAMARSRAGSVRCRSW